MKKKQVLPKVLTGTLILSVAGLISKILSAVYRVPFQNLVGNVGFYTYQQVYPFYGLEVTLALSGLPVFISRLVAEQDDPERQRAVAQRCWWILAVGGIALTVLLTLGAPWLAIAMGDRSLAMVIRGLAPVFLLMSWLAVGRGFAQGRLDMRPTAFSQVGEQVVRVAIIIMVAVLAWQNHWNVYRMGMLAMSSAPVAALVALAILVPTWRQIWRPLSVQRWRPAWGQLIKRLCREGLLLCWLASIMVVLQLVDSFTVKRALRAGGLVVQLANSQKGIFDRGQPLVQLGLVVATSFSAALLPTLAEHWRKGEKEAFAATYHTLNHVALVMAGLATSGLVFLMPQINQLLFVSRQGSAALAIMMLSIPLVTVISMDCSVLQSTNDFRAMVSALLTGLITKCLINFALVVHLGIAGASVGTVLSLAVTAGMTQLALPSILKRQDQQHCFDLKLLLIALIMGLVVFLAAFLMEWHLGSSRLAMIVILVVTIPLGVVIAGLLALKSKLLSRDEWLVLPGGRRIMSIIKKRG